MRLEPPPYPIKWKPGGSDVFTAYLPTLFSLEGGYSNSITDLGGKTCRGITENEMILWYRARGTEPPAIEDLTESEATDIYWSWYYYQPCLYWLPDVLSIAVFDWQVNGGRGIKDLQRVLGVPDDGILGHVTLNEIAYWLSRSNGLNRLLCAYQYMRRSVYYAYAHGDQVANLPGWLNRCYRVESYLGLTLAMS